MASRFARAAALVALLTTLAVCSGSQTYGRFDAFSDAECQSDSERFKITYFQEERCISTGDSELGSDASSIVTGNRQLVFPVEGCAGDHIWARDLEAQLVADACAPSYRRVVASIPVPYQANLAIDLPEAGEAADDLIVEAWYHYAASEEGAPCGRAPDMWAAYQKGACYRAPQVLRMGIFLTRADDLYVRRDCDADGAEVEGYYADANCTEEVDPTAYEAWGLASHAYELPPMACVSRPDMFIDVRNYGCARPAGPVGPFYWANATAPNSTDIRAPAGFSSSKKKKSHHDTIIPYVISGVVAVAIIGCACAYYTYKLTPVEKEVIREVSVVKEVPVEVPGPERIVEIERVVTVEVPPPEPAPVWEPEEPGLIDYRPDSPPPVFHDETPEPVFHPPDWD